MRQLDFVVWTVLCGVFIYMANLFLYCYFGELATESFDEMAVTLNDIKWFELPIKLQKYFIVMTLNMQRPLQYNGFAIANLNLYTFISVSKI